MNFGLRTLLLAWLIAAAPLSVRAEHGGASDASGGDVGTVDSGTSSLEMGAPSVSTQELRVYEHLMNQWEVDENTRLAAEKLAKAGKVKAIVITKTTTVTTPNAETSASTNAAKAYNTGALNPIPTLPKDLVANATPPATTVPAQSNSVATRTTGTVPNVVVNVSANSSAPASDSAAANKPTTSVEGRQVRETSAIQILWPESPKVISIQSPAASSMAATRSSQADTTSRWTRLVERMWVALTGRKPIPEVNEWGERVDVSTSPSDPASHEKQVSMGASGDTELPKDLPLGTLLTALGWGLAFLFFLWGYRLHSKLNRR